MSEMCKFFSLNLKKCVSVVALVVVSVVESVVVVVVLHPLWPLSFFAFSAYFLSSLRLFPSFFLHICSAHTTPVNRL